MWSWKVGGYRRERRDRMVDHGEASLRVHDRGRQQWYNRGNTSLRKSFMVVYPGYIEEVE